MNATIVRWTAIGVAVGCLAAHARAHQDPDGCFETGAVMVLEVFRADGTTGLVGTAAECETIMYRATLSKAGSGDVNCAFSDGTMTVTTPDGVVHVVSANVPCVGGNTSLEGCDPASVQLQSALLPYTVDPLDVSGGTLSAFAEYANGVTHDVPGNTAGVGVFVPKSVPVTFCADNDACTVDSCDPSQFGVDACVNAPVVCQDNNVCSVDSCDPATGLCVFAPAPSSTVCRPAAGVCDVTETCTGDTIVCPADSFASSATVCRSSAGVCDLAETCTGSSAPCPADARRPSGFVCRSTAGACDLAETCNGSTTTCPPDGFQSSGTVCRSAAGTCDLAEVCTGSGASCPANGFQPSGTVCRSTAGVCDVAESCTGSGAACPPDGFQPSGTICRSAAGACDLVATCTGDGASCPANGFQPSGTVCRSMAGVCDVAESCTGSGAACPPDGFQPSSTVCRSAAGVCDVAETCTGSGAACPPDGFQPSSTVCRSAAGVCDVADTCTGADATCPADAAQTDGAPCDDGLFCNGDDTCGGGQCGKHTGNPCPGPDGDADCAESCAEATDTCTAADPDGTGCNGGDLCKPDDVCQGGICQAGLPKECPPGQECVPPGGTCGPSRACLDACDDQNPCTAGDCYDATLGTCAGVPVEDGQTCQDDDDCTTAGNTCAAGSCGARDCDTDVKQVVENGKPLPEVEVDCLLFVRTKNGKPKKGTCTAQLLDATGRVAGQVATDAARRKKPKPAALSSKKQARFKNGVTTLRLELNELGRRLLGESPDGILDVEAKGAIKAGPKRRQISKLIGMRR
jgi:hypothetical protein